MSDCELPRFYSASEVVARKEHSCCECDAKILVGEKHFKLNAMWYGDSKPSTFRQHTLCEKTCEFVRDTGLNDDECLAYGELFPWFNEARNGGMFDSFYDKKDGDWIKLRGMIARIKRRERGDANKI